MPPAIQQSIVKYLNMAREFPDLLSEHRRLLAQNLMNLNVLRTGRNSRATADFLNLQAKKYQEAESTLLSIMQKHSTARQLIEKYPEFRDKAPGFIGIEMDLSVLDAPMIATIALLTGSILTMYDDTSYKIKVQNVLLARLQEERQKLNDGFISQEDYDNYVAALNVQEFKSTAPNLGGIFVITGLIFGGYYAINNYDKIEKKIRKALNP